MADEKKARKKLRDKQMDKYLRIEQRNKQIHLRRFPECPSVEIPQNYHMDD
jgi:hypothetical protein